MSTRSSSDMCFQLYSQPPLLSSMVLELYTATGDLDLLRRTFPSLLKEHSFWVSELHNVAIMDNDGCVHNLSRYQAMWNKPRPESATIDEELASKLNSTAAKEKLYHQIASTAETGWDFSSRWMRFDVHLFSNSFFYEQLTPELPMKQIVILPLINMYHMLFTMISFFCEAIQLT
jgi:neutral trehalase